MGKKTVKYVAVAVSLLLSALLMGITFWLSGALRGEVRESSENVEEYRRWSIPEKYTQLLLFPEKLPDSAENVEYYYKYESGWDRPMSQIFLSCTFDKEDYKEEEKRLSSLSWTSEEKGIVTARRDDRSFCCPAYVTIAGYDFCYEYALMCEERLTIVYIYSMNTIKDDVKFNEEFLPDYFMEGFEDLSVMGTDRFTMYGRQDSFLTE